MAEIKVVQYGLGPIGCATARLVAQRDDMRLVGGVEIDPSKVGRDLGNVIGLKNGLGIPVADDVSEFAGQADVAIHTTNSYFELFSDQVIDLFDAGLDVVSTSEELSFPWIINQAPAARLHSAACKLDRSLLGTGVNPGFLMDALPLFLTSICQRVDHVNVKRVINASQRRGPFQAKIGARLSVDEFEERMAGGRMGHVGLPESMGMIFQTLGHRLVRYEDDVKAVVADGPVETAHVSVIAGAVRGLEQVARGFTEEREFAKLTFHAALGAENAVDTITISGEPNLKVTLEGTNGDSATAAMAVNAIRRVREADPGLYTMRDLPIVTA